MIIGARKVLLGAQHLTMVWSSSSSARPCSCVDISLAAVSYSMAVHSVALLPSRNAVLSRLFIVFFFFCPCLSDVSGKGRLLHEELFREASRLA